MEKEITSGIINKSLALAVSTSALRDSLSYIGDNFNADRLAEMAHDFIEIAREYRKKSSESEQEGQR